MKKSSTFLFIFFLFLTLFFLTSINFLKDFSYLAPLGNSGVLAISGVLIIFIILLFIYREIENNKIINQFITIVTHKIKTPLTGIRWSINLLQKDLTLLEKEDLLMEMQKANDRLMEIIDLLVGFARFDNKLEHAPEAVSLEELIDASFNKNLAMIKDKNINFFITPKDNLPLVVVDKLRIQFAVDMLVDNAIKYTPANGKINISFEVNRDYLVLKINDSGIGMGYFDKKNIFKHFFRAKNAQVVDAGGLGLGLYTARKIVEHNKGKLWAESEGINKGSTFYLELPIKR